MSPKTDIAADQATMSSARGVRGDVSGGGRLTHPSGFAKPSTPSLKRLASRGSAGLSLIGLAIPATEGAVNAGDVPIDGGESARTARRHKPLSGCGLSGFAPARPPSGVVIWRARVGNRSLETSPLMGTIARGGQATAGRVLGFGAAEGSVGRPGP